MSDSLDQILAEMKSVGGGGASAYNVHQWADRLAAIQAQQAELEADLNILGRCIRDNTRTISVDMSGQHTYGFIGRPIGQRGSDVFEAIRKAYGGEGE